MIEAIRQLFKPKPEPVLPAVPRGERVYAIGDIHGRSDLFAEMIAAIERDDDVRGKARTTVILLGDLVDRGPDSATVVAMARDWQDRRKVRIIGGNHEEMFLMSFGELDVLRHFLRFGGRETLLSYPIDPLAFQNAEFEEVQRLMHDAIPQADRDFIARFEDWVAIGDYLFVHAGIRPNAAIDDQNLTDLRWIREPFLSHGGNYGYFVVHGHTITPEPDVRRNRIGIDTGAYMSGKLTALGLEGTERWLIEASEQDGAVASDVRAA